MRRFSAWRTTLAALETLHSALPQEAGIVHAMEDARKRVLQGRLDAQLCIRQGSSGEGM